MNRIYLVDESDCGLGGHNANYRNTINSIIGTEIYDNPKKFVSVLRNPWFGFINRIKYIANLPETGDICLLHIDTFLFVPNAIKRLKAKHSHVWGVLHWFPNNKLKVMLCKNTARYLDSVIVHSEYIKKQLNDIGVNNVTVINYPVFSSFPIDTLVSKKHSSKKVFTCLGSGRRDKGLDILMESLFYIADESASNIKIVIAGKELDISYAEFQRKAEDKRIEVEILNKTLTEEEYWKCVANTDVVLLPYKRIFTGNSGPMTDGVALDKYILGPDEGNLGYLINRYNLGSTFEIENPISLANEIVNVSRIDTRCKHEYKNRLTVDEFVASYRNLFCET